MKKISILIITLTIVAGSVKAQQQNLTTLFYSMSLGVGNTHEFISKYNWRGFGVDYRHMTSDKLGIGLNAGWNTLYEEEPYGTYTFETVSASGYQFRYMNSFPVIASADYFLRPGEKANPYIGGGLGVQYIIQTVDFGIYRFESDGWPFTINPEVGVLIKTPNGPLLNLGLKFMYAVKSGDLEAQSQLLFNVGFAFGE